MILTDYYFAQRFTDAGSRYDVTKSTQSYELFERLFINKRKYNVGGLSFNYVPIPAYFKAIEGKKVETVISKGSTSLLSVFVPDIQNVNIAYGYVNGTIDAFIFLFSPEKLAIEILIARGCYNDILALYEEIKGNYLDFEIDSLRAKAKDVFKG
jgi:hypothetical protein